MILLGNEMLYDPLTLENLLCVCEVINYMFEKLKEEQLEHLFKTFQFADLNMISTAVNVL